MEEAEWYVDCDGWYLYCSKCGYEPERGAPPEVCAGCGAKMKEWGTNNDERRSN